MQHRLVLTTFLKQAESAIQTQSREQLSYRSSTEKEIRFIIDIKQN